MMLQGKYFEKESNCFDVEAIIKDAYDYACATLETVEQVMSHAHTKYRSC